MIGKVIHDTVLNETPKPLSTNHILVAILFSYSYCTYTLRYCIIIIYSPENNNIWIEQCGKLVCHNTTNVARS